MIRKTYLEDITAEDLIEVSFESLITSLNLKLGLIFEHHSPGKIDNCLINELKVIKYLADNVYSNGNGPLLLGLECVNIENSLLYPSLWREGNIKPISIVSNKKLGLDRDQDLIKMINKYLPRGIGIIGSNHLNKKVIRGLIRKPVIISHPEKEYCAKLALKEGVIYKNETISEPKIYLINGSI